MPARDILYRLVGRDNTGAAAQSAQQNIGGVTRALNTARTAAAAFGTAVGTALVQLVQDAREAVREVTATSDALQVGVETAGQYATAARRAGIELNDFSTVLQRLQEIQVVDAHDSEPVRNALRRIGIDPDDPEFVNSTADELTTLFTRAFQRAGSRVASASAEELGITNLDLAALVRVQAELGTAESQVTIDDVISEAQIRTIETQAREVGQDVGSFFAEGVADLGSRLGQLDTDIESIPQLFRVIWGRSPARAARDLIRSLGDELDGLSASEIEQLALRATRAFADLGGRFGDETADALVRNFLRSANEEFSGFTTEITPDGEVIIGRQSARQPEAVRVTRPTISGTRRTSEPRGTPQGLRSFAEGGAAEFPGPGFEERQRLAGFDPQGRPLPRPTGGLTQTSFSNRDIVELLLRNPTIVAEVARTGDIDATNLNFAGRANPLAGLSDQRLAAIAALLERLVAQGEGNRIAITRGS